MGTGEAWVPLPGPNLGEDGFLHGFPVECHSRRFALILGLRLECGWRKVMEK